MSGPQFIHIETYARSVSSLRREREAARAEEGKVIDRKLSVEEICGEAARLPGHHPHLEQAKPPVQLWGVSPDQVPGLLDTSVTAANERIKAIKNAMPRGTRRHGPRAIRSDTHTLLGMVASYPVPWVSETTGEVLLEARDNCALLYKWEALNIAWAKGKAEALGFELASVVRHEDEPYPHLHFLAIPKNERLEARSCHPGYIARAAVERGPEEDDKTLKRRQNAAYNDAMRAFQDDYYQSVSLEVGLLRVGPRRRRVPSAVWKEEKTAARARGLASIRVERLGKEEEKKRQELQGVTNVLRQAEDDAANAILLTEQVRVDGYHLAQKIKAKEMEISSLETVMEHLESLPAELAREQAALDEAREERATIESEAAVHRSKLAGERDTIERDRKVLEQEWDDLDRERLALADAKKDVAAEKQKVDRERQAVATGQADLDALIEGVAAYADGSLRYNPADPAKPFNLRAPKDCGADLRDRLVRVKPRLLPIIQRIDLEVSRRATLMADALSAAVIGWSTGLLTGVGERRGDGQPTFHIPETPEGNRLLKLIDPFREVVARVVRVLPDRHVLTSVRQGITRLLPRLTAAEQEETNELNMRIQHLQQSRGEGRD